MLSPRLGKAIPPGKLFSRVNCDAPFITYHLDGLRKKINLVVSVIPNRRKEENHSLYTSSTNTNYTQSTNQKLSIYF